MTDKILRFNLNACEISGMSQSMLRSSINMVTLRRILLVLALATVVCAAPERRIIGGANALPGEVPHQVSLRFWGSNFHFAGGALITNRWVVSAANYLVGRAQDSINIVVGTTSLTANVANQRSDRIIIHADFNRDSNINNIGLVRSVTIIPITVFAQTIALGSTLIAPGAVARVSGWGATSPDKGPDSNFLQVRDIQVQACADNSHFSAQNQHLCAAAAVCTSDVGGPLVANNQLIGIAAWHDPFLCGSANGQDFYVRISVFRNWIMGNID